MYIPTDSPMYRCNDCGHRACVNWNRARHNKSYLPSSKPYSKTNRWGFVNGESSENCTEMHEILSADYQFRRMVAAPIWNVSMDANLLGQELISTKGEKCRAQFCWGCLAPWRGDGGEGYRTRVWLQSGETERRVSCSLLLKEIFLKSEMGEEHESVIETKCSECIS
jgi:hypothetical protein